MRRRQILTLPSLLALQGCGALPYQDRLPHSERLRLEMVIGTKITPELGQSSAWLFGSIGTLGTDAYVMKRRVIYRVPGSTGFGYFGGSGVSAMHSSDLVFGNTAPDFFEDPSNTSSSGARGTVFAAAVKPGRYESYAVTVQTRVGDRFPNGKLVLEFQHQFDVRAGESVYVGEYMTGRRDPNDNQSVYVRVRSRLDRDRPFAVREEPAMAGSSSRDLVPELSRLRVEGLSVES